MQRPVEDLVEALGRRSSSLHWDSRSSHRPLIRGRQSALQSSSYALENLSCTRGLRGHCVAIVLRDDKLTLWFYDAAGIIYTVQTLSLIDDFEMVAAIVVGLARCTSEQLGALPPAAMAAPAACPSMPKDLVGRVVCLPVPGCDNTVRVTLTKPRFAQYALTGRRTFLYEAEASSLTDGKLKLVIKLSYQDCLRQKEPDLVKTAHDARVGHIPVVHFWGDLWKLSDGVRRLFQARPGIVDEEDTAGDYEDRILRAVVYTDYAAIKPLFRKRCDLIPVMVDQMIDCTSVRPVQQSPS